MFKEWWKQANIPGTEQNTCLGWVIVLGIVLFFMFLAYGMVIVI
jgi:hypothetical protein